MFFNGITYNVSQVNGQLICMDVEGQFPETSEVNINFSKIRRNFNGAYRGSNQHKPNCL